VAQVEGKLKTLFASYKAGKDNANLTGAGSFFIACEQELDETLGSSKKVSHIHALDAGFGIDVVGLSDKTPLLLLPPPAAAAATTTTTTTLSPTPATTTLSPSLVPPSPVPGVPKP